MPYKYTEADKAKKRAYYLEHREHILQMRSKRYSTLRQACLNDPGLMEAKRKDGRERAAQYREKPEVRQKERDRAVEYYYGNYPKQFHYRLRMKKAAFDAYGGQRCSCCKETELSMLTIDHIGGWGAAHRRQLRLESGQSNISGGGMHIYRWLRQNNYPEGFRVLCWNCNLAIHLCGYCPHQGHPHSSLTDLWDLFTMAPELPVPEKEYKARGQYKRRKQASQGD